MISSKKTFIAGIIMTALLLAMACGGGSEETTSSTTTTTSTAAESTAAETETTATETESVVEVPKASESSGGYLATIDVSSIADGTMLDNGSIVVGGVAYGGIYNGYQEEPIYGGHLTLSTRRDLPGTDPMQTGGTISLRTCSGLWAGSGNIFRAARENVFNMEGFLAESWEVTENATVWTVKLHPNIKWHDGTPFLAEDLKYWIELAVTPPEPRQPSRYVTSFGDPQKLEVLDKLTLRVTLPKASPFWIELIGLAGNEVSGPKHLVQPELDAGNHKVQPIDYDMVSLGPFKFKSYDKGSVIKLERFNDYFEKDSFGRQLPFINSVNCVIMRDRGAMISAFRAGRLDGTSRGAGFGVLPHQEEMAKRDLGEKMWTGRVLYLGWGAGPNNSHAVWKDPNLRSAVSLFMDRPAIWELVWGGNAVTGALWQPGSPWAVTDVGTWPGYNPATQEEDRAESLKLIKAGGYEGMSVDILCRDVYIEMCEGLDGVFREMGFDSNITMTEITLLQERTPAGDFETIVTSTGAYSFPGEAVNAYVSTNPYGGMHHNDPYVDDLIDRMMTTTDLNARIKITQELETYAIRDMNYKIPFGKEIQALLYRSHVKGVPIPQTRVHNSTDYATAWIDPGEK